MSVSSSEELEFYPIPEFKNLLSKTQQLRREVTGLGVMRDDATHYERLLKSLDDLEESLYSHFKELHGLERDLLSVASTRLTKKQCILLRWLLENYSEDLVYTTLIDRVSEDLHIAKSTVRWNMRGLRDSGLIQAGDKEDKGIPVRLTEKGILMSDYFAFRKI